MSVNYLAAVPQTDLIAACVSTKNQDAIIVWNLDTDTTYTLDVIEHGEVVGLCSAKHQITILVQFDGHLEIWVSRSLVQFDQRVAIESYGSEITCFSLSNDGAFVAVGLDDRIQIIESRSGHTLKTLLGYYAAFGENHLITVVQRSPHQIVQINYDIDSARSIIPFHSPEPILRIVESQDSHQSFLWDTFSIYRAEFQTATISSITESIVDRTEEVVPYIPGDINYSEALVVSAWGKNEIWVMDIDRDVPYCRAICGTTQITDIIFSSDGQYIIIGNLDDEIALWELKSCSLIRVKKFSP